ncbi:unnamed protein product [Gongylonema pulchrum]|uniref:Uncharacterized protein n=1 Tax=Gongylonema pulchrum TaxID=637853 RepID=A0A3P7ME04_9BILA|nr:unnamed protein product [Gongylonema pulchrum]
MGASLSFSLIIRVIRTVSTLFSFTSSMWDIFMFCLITAHALSFFSNSYIVFESSAIRELKMARFLFGIFVVGGALHYGAKSLNIHPSEVWNSSLLFPAPLTIVLHWMTYWLSEEMAARNPQFPLLTAQIVYGLSTLSIILLACRITVGENITNMYGCSLSYLFSIAASLILILGDGLVFSFVTLIVIMFLIRHVTEDEHYQLTIIVLLMSHGFFALSHQPVFSSIPWQAAFIGIPGNFSWQALPATLVIMHIFAAHIIVCAALPMFMTQQLEHHYGLAHWSYKLLFFYSLKVCITLLIVFKLFTFST